jgi:hypothetical protein
MNSAANPLARPRSRIVGVCLTAVALVLFRSLVWTLWEQSDFDSDQAISGLMAKHLAELRAFPLMFYGQQYMLAVEAWLTAPFFALFGVSVLTLRLPLIAINIVVACLLIDRLVRDAGLTPRAALIASLFFLVPPPVTASRLVEAASNIESFLYVLLLWLMRMNPIAFGLIAGVGFLHREFTAYAVSTIVLLEIGYGTFFTATNIKGKAIAFAEFVGVGLAVRALMNHGDLLGPGTANTLAPEVLNSQPGFWLAHFCWNPSVLLPNLRWLARENMGVLFGWRVGPLSAYARSTLTIGHAWVWVPGVVLAAAAALIGIRRASSGEPAASRTSALRANGIPRTAFPAFLLIVGLQAIVVYAFMTCEVQDGMLVRYTLLALLIPVGLTAMVLRSDRSHVVQAVAVLAVVAWAAPSATDNVRLLAEYVSRPPQADYRNFANFLEREGVRYGRAPYWTAYQIDFITNERVILGSFEKVRVTEYEDAVNRHAAQSTAVFIDDPCTDPGDVVFGRWCMMYFERARHVAPGS